MTLKCNKNHPGSKEKIQLTAHLPIYYSFSEGCGSLYVESNFSIVVLLSLLNLYSVYTAH